MSDASITNDNGCSQHLPALTSKSTDQTAVQRADHEFERAAVYAAASKSAATKRAYASDFATYAKWCAPRDLSALPTTSGTLSTYLSALADEGKKVATVRRALAAITYAHRLRGLPAPGDESTKAVMAGIRRELGVKPEQKQPATVETIRKLLKLIPGTVAGARDRALLLLGFAGALRRSELVGLEFRDLERQAEGLVLHLRRSKTDQEGAGRTIAIPRDGKLKVVEALDAWLNVAGITAGPLFRSVNKAGQVGPKLSDGSVAAILKRYATRAGLDPDLFAGHSLRAGFVTSALAHGADAFRVMDVTGHRDVRTLKGYDRRAKFLKHAGRSFL